MNDATLDSRITRVENDTAGVYDILTGIKSRLAKTETNTHRIAKNVVKIDGHVGLMQINMNARMSAMEKRWDDRFDIMERRNDERFAATEARFNAIDERFTSIDERFNEFGSILTTILSRLPAPEPVAPALRAVDSPTA